MTPEDALRDKNKVYMRVFDGPEGQSIIQDLEAHYHINNTTFRHDSHATAYSEGQRSVVLYIKSMLKPLFTDEAARATGATTEEKS